MKKIKKAVFPVGGFGTRFLPITKSIPKEMFPFVDKPIIHYAVEEAIKSGIEEFIFVVGAGKDAIKNYFSINKNLEEHLRNNEKFELLEVLTNELPNPECVKFVFQENPLGLGHAIWCAREFFSENEFFAIVLPDDVILGPEPCLKELVSIYENHSCNVISVMEVEKQNVSKYGILDFHERKGNFYKVTNIVEKPNQNNAPSNVAVVGRYILSSKVFDYLSLQKKGKNSEIQITDSITSLLSEQTVLGVKFSGKRYDCGHRRGYIEAFLEKAISEDSNLLPYLRNIINSKMN